MRIIGGTHRGRRIAAPPGHGTRPTTDRVRESLFSVLVSAMGPALHRAAVLDPFAGSGALALEALSRGAARATVVEKDRRALATLRSNVSELGLESAVTVIGGDVLSLSASRLVGGPFSLILLDPPYTLDAAVVAALLERLAASGVLEQGCVVSWEYAADTPYVWPRGFEVIASKRYGTTAIEFAEWDRGETGS